MDTDQVAKGHSDHTKELATHWDAQLATLMNAFKLSSQTPSFPAIIEFLYQNFREMGVRMLMNSWLFLKEQLVFISLTKTEKWRSSYCL